MPEWNDEYEGILICYTDKLVQVKCDDKLMNYLALPGKGAVKLAKHLKENYKNALAKELDITVDSLAIEILAHAYVDKFAETIEQISDKLTKKKKTEIVQVMEKIKERTGIIDCGEKSIDSNRFVWDLLKPFAPVIYMMMGKYA